MSALEPTPGDAYERKVFDAFVQDGRLIAIPAKRKKREILLKHMVNAFERQRVYREVEVNAVLSEFHEDVASLRREMIDMGLLIRYRGEYARPEPVEMPQTR
jgi:hypothetical protein